MIGKCVKDKRKKINLSSDNTKQAKGFCKFFRNVGRSSAEAGEKLAAIELKISRRVLVSETRIGSTAVSKSSKAVSSTVRELITFQPRRKEYISWNMCVDTKIKKI